MERSSAHGVVPIEKGAKFTVLLALSPLFLSLSLYIYIYIICVLFGPVKPELRVIPSGQENHSRAEHLNFLGKELNVINFTEQYFL